MFISCSKVSFKTCTCILDIAVHNWILVLWFSSMFKNILKNTWWRTLMLFHAVPTHPLIHETVVLNSLLIPVTHPSPPHFPSLPLLMLRWNPRSFLSQSGTHGPAEPLPVIITRLVIDAAVNHYDWHVWINWLIVEIRGLSYQQKALEFTNV